MKHGPFFYKVYPRTRAPIPLTPEEEVSEEEEVQDEEVPEEEEKQAAQGAQENLESRLAGQPVKDAIEKICHGGLL